MVSVPFCNSLTEIGFVWRGLHVYMQLKKLSMLTHPVMFLLKFFAIPVVRLTWFVSLNMFTRFEHHKNKKYHISYYYSQNIVSDQTQFRCLLSTFAHSSSAKKSLTTMKGDIFREKNNVFCQSKGFCLLLYNYSFNSWK